MVRNLSRALAMWLVIVPAVALAQSNQQTRVRGIVQAVDGQTLTVKGRGGETVPVQLAPNYTVSAVEKASLSDIKQGMFVGSAARPRPDGTLTAIEVHIFPEAQRGTGEGSRPWDLGPTSSMTNANVAATVDSVDGRVLTMAYPGGEKKIVVPPDAPVVFYAPADQSDLHAGVPVSLGAQKLPDGSLQASRIIVGRGGIVPPM
jgi:hypothetical protein